MVSFPAVPAGHPYQPQKCQCGSPECFDCCYSEWKGQRILKTFIQLLVGLAIFAAAVVFAAMKVAEKIAEWVVPL